MRRALISVLLAGAGCSSGSNADAGIDAGGDAGPPPLTDGGAIDAKCLSLDSCAGNPFCTDVSSCAYNVICANGVCAAAGGAAVEEAVSLTFAGSASNPFPSYLQVYLLAPQLVGSGALTCEGILDGVDGGTLDPTDSTEVNPLIPDYETNVPGNLTTADATMTFAIGPAASGSTDVLYIEGYLDTGNPDGGAKLLGRACTTFDLSAEGGDGGITGTISLTMNAVW